jgi:hypothetical protein
MSMHFTLEGRRSCRPVLSKRMCGGSAAQEERIRADISLSSVRWDGDGGLGDVRELRLDVRVVSHERELEDVLAEP